MYAALACSRLPSQRKKHCRELSDERFDFSRRLRQHTPSYHEGSQQKGHCSDTCMYQTLPALYKGSPKRCVPHIRQCEAVDDPIRSFPFRKGFPAEADLTRYIPQPDGKVLNMYIKNPLCIHARSSCKAFPCNPAGE